MPSDATITSWVAALRDGKHDAAQKLWEVYFPRLVKLALRRLQGRRPRAADEEDVALSAFNSFCRGLERGRFPRLDTPDNLWQLLTVITARKAVDVIERESAKKRNPGAPPSGDIEQIVGAEPTPAFAAQMADECERLLRSLGDETLERVALLKMEGYLNQEIADLLGVSERSVNRKLQAIRALWDR